MRRSFLWTLRACGALGLLGLSLTEEITLPFLAMAWFAWMLSFVLDRFPASQAKLRRYDILAVTVLIAIAIADWVLWKSTLFVTVAHFLLLIQAFKYLGLKERKDCLHIILISFFQILSSCTLSADVAQAFILLSLIPLSTVALFWLEVQRQEDVEKRVFPAAASKPYRQMAWIMGLLSLPINALVAGTVFIIFPRLTFNAALPGLGNLRSGYTDQLNLAQTGTVQLDNTPVLWLDVGTQRSRWNGYLRGDTLDFFDGKHWSRSGRLPSVSFSMDSGGLSRIAPLPPHTSLLHQTITLLDTHASTLYVAPNPIEVIAPMASLRRDEDGALHWSSGWRKPLRYQVLSADTAFKNRYGVISRDNQAIPIYLELPAVSLTRTRALIQSLHLSGSAKARAATLVAYLQTHYRYSANFGETATENPLEDFLFKRKEGACGHFASALAVMLRLEGIPARVVGGYLRGEWNEPAQQILIREKDAHAWVEAYIGEEGWIRLDPSPRASSLTPGARWKLRLIQELDYLTYQWDSLVIEYDLYSQVRLIQTLQSSPSRMNNWIDRLLPSGHTNPSQWKQHSRLPSWKSLLAIMGSILILPAAGKYAWSHWRAHPPHENTSIAVYYRFLEEMAQQGHPRRVSETGWEYARRLASLQLPFPSEAIQTITEQYYTARFGKTTMTV